jgi:hypothetical protein
LTRYLFLYAGERTVVSVQAAEVGEATRGIERTVSAVLKRPFGTRYARRYTSPSSPCAQTQTGCRVTSFLTRSCWMTRCHCRRPMTAPLQRLLTRRR